MNEFKIYLSNGYQNKFENYYPNEITINSTKDLLKANQYDFVMADFENHKRAKANFISGDVLFADFDEGYTIQEFQNKYSDYEYYITTSKSHLIEKNNIVCERFHILFPIQNITDVNEFEEYLKLLIQELKSDPAVKDCSRFFYGYKNTEIIYNDGESIIALLDENKNNPTVMLNAILEDKYGETITSGNRNSSLLSLLRTWANKKRKELTLKDFQIEAINVNDTFNPSLEISEVGSVAKQAFKYYYQDKENNEIKQKTLKDEFQEIVNEIKEEFKDYVKYTIGSKVVIGKRDGTEFYNRINFIQKFSHLIYKHDDKTILSPQLYFDRLSPNYKGIKFDPSNSLSDEYLNSFTGFTYESVKGDKHKSFIKFIQEVLCNNDKQKFIWVMTWIGQLFQESGNKIGTAIAINGKQGTGKTFFVDRLLSMIGRAGCTVQNIDGVIGQFNSQACDKLLVYCDEVTYACSKKERAALKKIMTGRTVFKHLKGFEPQEIPDFARYIFTSNDEFFMSSETDDRRTFVLTISEEKKLDYKYFESLLNDLENDGYENLLYCFLNTKFDFSILRNVPKTKEKKEQIEQTLEGSLLEHIMYLIDGGIDEVKDFTKENHIIMKYLFQNFCEVVKTKYSSIQTQNKYSRELNKLIPFKSKRIENYRYLELPTIDELKNIVNKQIGYNYYEGE